MTPKEPPDEMTEDEVDRMVEKIVAERRANDDGVRIPHAQICREMGWPIPE